MSSEILCQQIRKLPQHRKGIHQVYQWISLCFGGGTSRDYRIVFSSIAVTSIWAKDNDQTLKKKSDTYQK